MTCREGTQSLGVYLLGALDADERAAVEAHLAVCPDCRNQLDDLAGIPPVLGRLSLDDVMADVMAVPPAPPEDLYERVAAQARAERDHVDEVAVRRNRHRRLLAAAAAVVMLAGAGIGLFAATRSHQTVFRTASGPVHMDVTLASAHSGTTLAVSVSGLPVDEHCRLIAISDSGARDVAGRWDATYSGRAQETGSTSIPRADLARLVLLGDHGEQLAAVNV